MGCAKSPPSEVNFSAYPQVPFEPSDASETRARGNAVSVLRRGASPPLSSCGSVDVKYQMYSGWSAILSNESGGIGKSLASNAMFIRCQIHNRPRTDTMLVFFELVSFMGCFILQHPSHGVFGINSRTKCRLHSKYNTRIHILMPCTSFSVQISSIFLFRVRYSTIPIEFSCANCRHSICSHR